MKMYAAKNVDDYIAGSAAAARPPLKELRQIIKTTIPTVEEKISWGIPFYRYRGPLVGFASFKNHVSFGLGMTGLSNEDRKLLGQKGYVTGSKIIQIRFDQKVPVTLIRKLIKEKMRQNEAKQQQSR